MYKVLNKETNKWILEKTYLSQNDDLYIIENKSFKRKKYNLLLPSKYAIYHDIGLYDVNKKLIFEGDWCKAADDSKEIDKDFLALVSYYPMHGCCYLFDVSSKKYYPINENVCNNLIVVSDISKFNIDIKNDDKQTLQ